MEPMRQFLSFHAGEEGFFDRIAEGRFRMGEGLPDLQFTQKRAEHAANSLHRLPPLSYSALRFLWIFGIRGARLLQEFLLVLNQLFKPALFI